MMYPKILIAVGLVVTLTAGLPSPLHAGFEPVPDKQPEIPQAPDPWPIYTLSLGATYVPAPTLSLEFDQEFYYRKMLDQAGVQCAFDWRFTHELLVGFQVDTLANKDGWLVEARIRFGGLYKIDEHLAIHGRISVGISHWSTNNWIDLEYTGPQVGLAVGIRSLLMDWFGLYAEIGGTLALYEVGSGLAEESDFFTKDTEMLKLHINMGVLFGW